MKFVAICALLLCAWAAVATARDIRTLNRLTRSKFRIHVERLYCTANIEMKVEAIVYFFVQAMAYLSVTILIMLSYYRCYGLLHIHSEWQVAT